MKALGGMLKLLALAVLSAVTAARAQEFALGKGADAKSRTEAAELSYLDDSAKGSSYAIAAAVFWMPQATYSAAGGTLQWDLAAGINKNTVTGDKRVEKQLLAFGARHVYSLGAKDEMLTRAAFERRRNRLSGGNESAFSALSQFNIDGLKVFGSNFQLKPFPFAGVYRTSTRGNTGAGASNGTFGGAVAGIDLAIDLAMGTKRWAIIDLSLRRQFERNVSGDFRSANYDLGSAELKFPFSIADAQAAISLGHVRGTDRLGGTPWKRQTLLKFTLKFGNT